MFSKIMGVLVGTFVFAIIAMVAVAIFKLIQLDDPCHPRNIAERQVLIESHERCMGEENCIYEDWDIRRYDARIGLQEQCRVEEE